MVVEQAPMELPRPRNTLTIPARRPGLREVPLTWPPPCLMTLARLEEWLRSAGWPGHALPENKSSASLGGLGN